MADKKNHTKSLPTATTGIEGFDADMSDRDNFLPPGASAELERLVDQLHDVQQRLVDLTGGQIDAVTHRSGRSYLLHDAQQHLRERESHQRQYAKMQATILNSLPAHIALLNLNGVIIAVNDSWRDFAVSNRYSGANFGVGLNYIEICERAGGRHASEGIAVAEGIRAILARRSDHFVLEYPCHSGDERRWFRMIVSPLELDDGSGAVVMHVDITDRKLTEEALRDSEATHRRLFEHNPLPLWVYDLESLSFLAVNDAAIQHYGYSREEFLGMTIADIRPQEDVPALRDNVARIAGGIDRAGIWRHRLKNGRVISVEVTSHTLEYGGRRAVMVLAIDVTERLEAEAALMAMQQQTSLILSSIGEGIHVLDVGGNVLFSNPAANRMLGWSEVEMYGQHSHTLIHHHHADGRDYPSAECPIYRTLRDGVTRQISGEVFFRKDRSSFPVAYVCAPIIDPKGDISGVVVSFRDIGEHQLAQAELNRKDTLLHLAGKLARVGGWEVALPDYRIAWSDEICEILEIPRDRLPSIEEALDLYTPESRQLMSDVLERCLRNGEPFNVELRVRTMSGEWLWVRCLGEPVYDADGSILKARGAFQDITDYRRLYDQLAESSERFRHVAQATVDAIWDWDLVNDKVWWNSGMQSLFGHRLDELPPDSSSWTLHLHPDDHDAVLADIHRVIDGGEDAWESRYRFRRASGSYARVIDRGFVVRDDRGKAIRMVGGMTDVTRQLQLEEQLRQAQRLESVGQLTGGVAHDFNNLLTVMLGNAELLAEELAPRPQLKALATMITEAAQRGADLTRRLLAFARRQPLEPEVVLSSDLIAGMDNMLRRTLGEHIEVEFVRGGGLWQTMVDPGQLESALLNLCINARDAMGNGGRLTIETANASLDQNYADLHADVQPGQYVMIAVSDTGAGITPEDLGRVFEPFFTTKAPGKGTGLGLSMVYGFIKQSRGHIKIYSESGQGTTVRMYLPRYLGDQKRVAAVKPEAVATGGSETILLVEDDPMVLRYAQNQMEALGYRVLSASSGRRALEILREQGRVDLLFTDVVMPGGMNGRELADEARKMQPDLKVLYTSGYTENAIVHHGRLDPGVQLLSKPYRRLELARRIRRVLEQDNDAGEGA